MHKWADEIERVTGGKFMVSREGQRLGNYKLVRLLGREAVGEVYFAEDVQYHHRVSVIVVSKHLEQSTFLEKTRKLSRLRHPNIVQLEDFGVEGSWPFFLVFNNPRTKSLRERHPKGSILELDTIMPYIKQVAAALQYAHKAGFTNLFVRPENMLVGKKNEIQLGGFESLFADWNDEDQDIGLDLSYIAPEFFKDQHLPASDQYALATVIYEWLCGSCPFTPGNILKQFVYNMQKVTPPSILEKNSAIPNIIADVIMKALVKKPGERFESVTMFADAMEQAYKSTNIANALTPSGQNEQGKSNGENKQNEENKKDEQKERLTGQQFGNYRLIQILGHGSKGIVYLGEHTDLKLQRAIKLLYAEYDTDEFENGIQRIAKLSHPHILRIMNFSRKDKTLFLEMEYAPNGSLLQRHPKGTIVPLSTVISYVKQIATALKHAHDYNVVHGRLSPAEMFLSKDDDILLSGFEPLLVLQNSVKLAHTDSIYSSPEHAQGKVRPASDQYMLAVIVYEWLSGKLPWLDGIARTNEIPAPLSLYVPGLPAVAEETILKALQKEPKQRYNNVQDFADALEQSVRPSGHDNVDGELVGKQFGDYVLKSWLGEGGFGKVYRGEHHSLGRLAAVKILQLDRRITEKDKKQFRNEAQALARLEHPRIARIQDYGVKDDTPYLVMDYYSGGSLRKHYPRGSRLPLEIVLIYIKQIAEALQHAHNRKLVHRDVKPENVLFSSNNEVVLSDFGLVITAHDTHSREEQDKLGTGPYMSHEHFDGKAVPASDQYSLAIMTYELIRGSRPFEGNILQLAYQASYMSPPPLQANVTQITSSVEQVILKALAKNPKERFASVEAYAEALAKAIDEE